MNDIVLSAATENPTSIVEIVPVMEPEYRCQPTLSDKYIMCR